MEPRQLDDDVSDQYRRLLQAAAAAADPDTPAMLDLLHFASCHVQLDPVDLEILLQFVCRRAERSLYSNPPLASSSFLVVQFAIARLIALKASDLDRCLRFLIQFSSSWPICQQRSLADRRSINDLIASLKDSEQTRCDHDIAQSPSQDHAQTCLLLLLAICLILTQQPASALSVLSLIGSGQEGRVALLTSIALYFKSKLVQDRPSIDLALDALVSELNDNRSSSQYDLHFMRGYLLACQDRHLEAIGCFKLCLSGDYRRHDSSLMIAVCLIESHNLDTAIEYLHRSILDKDLEMVSAFNVAIIKERQSLFDEASTLYAAILDECDQALGDIPITRQTVLLRLVHICITQSKFAEALKFLQMITNGSRLSLEIVRLHVYVLLNNGHEPSQILMQCDTYLSSYPNDPLLLMYQSETLFAMRRFDDCLRLCDEIIARCSALQAAVLPPASDRHESGQRSWSLQAVSDDNVLSATRTNRLPMLMKGDGRFQNMAAIKSQAYLNKGVCHACLNQYDQAIAMTQWALFHHQSIEAEFNLCVLLVKIGRSEIACARWLQYQGVDLSLPGPSYQEQLQSLDDVPGWRRPETHIVARLGQDQVRTLTKLALQQWIQIRSDHLFTKKLQQLLRSC